MTFPVPVTQTLSINHSIKNIFCTKLFPHKTKMQKLEAKFHTHTHTHTLTFWFHWLIFIKILNCSIALCGDLHPTSLISQEIGIVWYKVLNGIINKYNRQWAVPLNFFVNNSYIKLHDNLITDGCLCPHKAVGLTMNGKEKSIFLLSTIKKALTVILDSPCFLTHNSQTKTHNYL